MQNTSNNTQKINSKRLSKKYEPSTPTSLKDAVKAILLQQKENIMSKV